MAIAYDSSSAKSTSAWNSGTSMTWSHTTSGSDRFLVVAVFINEGDYISGVTYNGATMTQANKVNGGDGWEYLYYLINPTVGANNVVVSLSSSSFYMDGFASSYTGVKQTSQPDASVTNTVAVNNVSISSPITTVASNCWIVGFFRNNTGGTINSRTGITSRQAYSAGGLDYGDSNGAVASGVNTISETCAITSKWGSCLISISPVVVSGPANLKSYNTNLKENIKSINTNLIGNIKSLDTNA